MFSHRQGSLRNLILHCCAYGDPKSSNLELFSIDLLVPAFTLEHFTVGVSVESYAGDGPPDFIVRRKDRFCRFVRNNYSRAMFALSVDEDVGIVEMSCYRQESSTMSLQIMLRFDKGIFMDAFTSHPGRIDFCKLEQGVLSICVGNVLHDPRDPWDCECTKTRCSNCHMASGSAMFEKNLRKFNKPSIIGTAYFKGSLTIYNKTIQIFSVLMSTNFERIAGAASCGVEQLVRWGLSDRLCRLKPVPKYVLEYSDAGQNIEHVRKTKRKVGGSCFVPIAPLPTHQHEKEQDSVSTEVDKKHHEKILQRNIRKREAAFRSNAKRKEIKTIGLETSAG